MHCATVSTAGAVAETSSKERRVCLVLRATRALSRAVPAVRGGSCLGRGRDAFAIQGRTLVLTRSTYGELCPRVARASVVAHALAVAHGILVSGGAAKVAPEHEVYSFEAPPPTGDRALRSCCRLGTCRGIVFAVSDVALTRGATSVAARGRAAVRAVRAVTTTRPERTASNFPGPVCTRGKALRTLPPTTVLVWRGSLALTLGRGVVQLVVHAPTVCPASVPRVVAASAVMRAACRLVTRVSAVMASGTAFRGAGT